jgi:hypothetical protein
MRQLTLFSRCDRCIITSCHTHPASVQHSWLMLMFNGPKFWPANFFLSSWLEYGQADQVHARTIALGSLILSCSVGPFSSTHA